VIGGWPCLNNNTCSQQKYTSKYNFILYLLQHLSQLCYTWTNYLPLSLSWVTDQITAFLLVIWWSVEGQVMTNLSRLSLLAEPACAYSNLPCEGEQRKLLNPLPHWLTPEKSFSIVRTLLLSLLFHWILIFHICVNLVYL